jgi:hypothetical protein
MRSFPRRPLVELPLEGPLLVRLRDRVSASLGPPASADARQRLDDAVDRIRLTARPRGSFVILPVRAASEAGVELEVGTLHSTRVGRYTAQCQGERYVAFLAVTLGEQAASDSREAGGLTTRYLRDVVASALTEETLDRLVRLVVQVATAAGLQCSQRLGPGYCDWDLSGQRLVLGAVDAAAIGLSLTAACVLRPDKSLTAALILATRVPAGSQCEACGQPDCAYRHAVR